MPSGIIGGDIDAKGKSAYPYKEVSVTIDANSPTESPIMERLERTYAATADNRLALEVLCGQLLGDEKTRGEPIMPDQGAFMPRLHLLASAIESENELVKMYITRISKGVR